MSNPHSKIKVHSSIVHSAMKVVNAANKMPFKYTKWRLETPEVTDSSTKLNVSEIVMYMHGVHACKCIIVIIL